MPDVSIRCISEFISLALETKIPQIDVKERPQSPYLNLGFDILDGFTGFHLKGDRFPRQRFHENLHLESDLYNVLVKRLHDRLVSKTEIQQCDMMEIDSNTFTRLRNINKSINHRENRWSQ